MRRVLLAVGNLAARWALLMAFLWWLVWVGLRNLAEELEKGRQGGGGSGSSRRRRPGQAPASPFDPDAR